nr:MAG TPA: terminase small subunit [Siphoviridae sp. ctEdl3]
MARPITANYIRKATVKNMKSLGTYRKEFDYLINIYANMLYQYILYEEEHAANNYKVADMYVNKAGAENLRKLPLINVMETLRKDILSYSDKLMLNPKALGEVIAQDTGGTILDIMNRLGGAK